MLIVIATLRDVQYNNLNAMANHYTSMFTLPRIAIVLSILTIAGCENQKKVPSKGLTQVLANERFAQVKNVTYDLNFIVPDDKSIPVVGNLTLKLQLVNRKNLVLDFNGPDSTLKLTSINETKNPSYQLVNGHLVIPKKYLNVGENTISMTFQSDSRTLNRNRNYLYTLNVPNKASRIFPCFDQPDIKAIYNLSLQLPLNWTAVANAPIASDKQDTQRRNLRFGSSDKISTYLFAFAAGEFKVVKKKVDGKDISLYHLEADTVKVKRNSDEIFNQIGIALTYMETYTGIKYPFQKYDLVAIPAFQFSGMEHPGAVYYKSSQLFLDKQPTANERLNRASLIAHETAHMWFGDLVTMKWFNDVWLKEVFANFFAAKIANPQFPNVNHDLLFMLSNYPRALSIDRTAGTHPIAQELENQDNAASIYGSIIYNKAPIAVRMLETSMGVDSFQHALQSYLKQYSYSNATWKNLLSIFEQHSRKDLNAWNQAWIYGEGIPEIDLLQKKDSKDEFTIVAKNRNNYQRFPQSISFAAYTPNHRQEFTLFQLPSSFQTVDIKGDPPFIVPNSNGLGYAIFHAAWLQKPIPQAKLIYLRPIERASLLINQKELAIEKAIPRIDYLQFICDFIANEKVEELLQQASKDLEFCYWQLLTQEERGKSAEMVENILLRKLESVNDHSARLVIFKSLAKIATTTKTLQSLNRIWFNKTIAPNLPLGENDQVMLCLELALKQPEMANQIINDQLKSLSSKELIDQLKFESAAISQNKDTLKALFNRLSKKENRTKEPWVAEALSYLNHPIRNEACITVLSQSLLLLPEIKQTGDIFFPKSWADAVLWGYHSEKAKQIVVAVLNSKALTPDLRLKLLQSADLLMRK